MQLGIWHDDDPDESLAKVDRQVRSAVQQRLIDSLRALLKEDDRTTRLAGLTLIRELGPEIRSALGGDERHWKGAIRALGPDLVQFLQTGPGDLHPAAARALSRINPDPAVAVPALESLLKSSDVNVRRAGAEAIQQLIRVDEETPWGRREIWVETFQTAAAGTPAAAAGLSDSDAEVRRTCAATLHAAASNLHAFLSRPGEHSFSGPERPQRDEGPEFRAATESAQKLAEQIPTLAQRLADADVQTVLATSQALEALSDARFISRKQATSQRTALSKDIERALSASLLKAVPALAKQLTHAEVEVRLAALYVLESLQTDAAPAIDAVTKSLQDADPFARWGAARVLGQVIAPDSMPSAELAKSLNKAAPELARLLKDENRDIRITAAAALERFGEAAQPAVEGIAMVISDSDPETSVLAIKCIIAIGPAAKKSAIPALLKAVAAKDASVRAAALEGLSRLGPPDQETIPALTKSLSDPDAKVRRAAADALLAGK